MAADKTEAEERDETTTGEGDDAAASVDPDEERLGEQIDGEERWKEDETVSDKATCPECGEPVHNLRMTCPMCGHEYKGKEYDDEEAGTEFRAGAEVDDGELGEKVKESQSATHSDDDEEE